MSRSSKKDESSNLKREEATGVATKGPIFNAGAESERKWSWKRSLAKKPRQQEKKSVEEMQEKKLIFWYNSWKKKKTLSTISFNLLGFWFMIICM
ncbi:hypothetical protein V2J09_000593 [Rumex salicifolius]